jgi:hypothetical protein
VHAVSTRHDLRLRVALEHKNRVVPACDTRVCSTCRMMQKVPIRLYSLLTMILLYL